MMSIEYNATIVNEHALAHIIKRQGQLNRTIYRDYDDKSDCDNIYNIFSVKR